MFEDDDQQWPGTAHDDTDATVPPEAQYTTGESWPGQEWPGTEVKATADEWPGQEWPGTEVSQKPEAEGMVATAGREAAHAVVPAATGVLTGGVAGAIGGSLAGPVGAFVGGVGGMIAGSLGGDYVQDKALKAAGVDDDVQRAVNKEKNPVSSFVGGVAPFIGSPLVGAEKTLAGQFTGNALKQRAAGGAMMTAFEGGHQLYEGEFHPGELAGSALFGAAMPSGNAATRAIHGAGEGLGARFVPGRPDLNAPNKAVDTADADVSQSPSVAGNNALAQQPAADPKAPIGQENSKAAGPENYSKTKVSQDEVFGQTGFGGFSEGAVTADKTVMAALMPEETLPKPTGIVEAAGLAPQQPAPPPVDPRIEQARQMNAAIENQYGNGRMPAEQRQKYNENVALIRGQKPEAPPVEQFIEPKPVEQPKATLRPDEVEVAPEDQATRLAGIEARNTAPTEPAPDAPIIAKAPPAPRVARDPNAPRDRTAEKEALKNKLGMEAKSPAERDKHNSAIDAIQKAFDEHAPGETETAADLTARLKGAVNTAHEAHGSNPLHRATGYRPRNLPETFQWFRKVQEAALKRNEYWTQDKIDAFKAEEALLRDKAGKETEYPFQDNRLLDAEIERTQRSGDTAERTLDKRAVNPEDALIEALDARGKERKPFETIDSSADETAYVEPRRTEIKTRADLPRTGRVLEAKPYEPKTAEEAPRTSLIEPVEEKPAKKEKKPKYDFEGTTKSGKELSPADAARYLKMAEDAQTKDRIARETKPSEIRDLGDKYSPLKTGVKDLFGKIADLGHDESAKLDLKKMGDDLKGLFAKFAKTPEKYGPEMPSYIAKRLTSDEQRAGRNVAEMLNTASKVDNVIKVHALAGKEQAHVLANTKVQQRQMYDALEKQDPSLIKNDTLRDVFEHSIVPTHFETTAIRKWIQENHPEVNIGRDTEDGVHRRAINGGNAEMELESIGENADPTAGSSPISTTKRSPVMERQFVALEDADGNRHIVHLQLGANGKPTGEFSVWKNYKNKEAEGAPPLMFDKVGDIYEVGNRRFKMKDATTDEIEANALGNDGKPMQYQRDAAASVYTANAYFRQLLNHLNTLDQIKNSPEFKAYATGSADVAGKNPGWQKSDTPGFDRYWMDDHLRETLEDAYQQGFTDSSLNKIRNFSRAMTQSIFWTPVAHIMNVEVHWAVGRGFKWLPTVDNYRGLAETGTQAIKSVITHDKIQDILHENGAGLIYGGTRAENATQRLALGVGEAIKRNPTGWGPVADKMNMTVGELVRGVYKASRHAMWSANDMFLTQAILERLRDHGKTAESASPVEIREAIAHIERHIPNYRTPSRIMSADDGGRTIAKFMRDPLVFGFGRYRYGMFNSYANMVNSVLHGSKAERIETAGQMMVMGAIALAVYPLVYKPIAQLITGNEAAEVRGRGPVAPFMHVKNDLFGRGDIGPLLRETASVSPLVATAMDLYKFKDFGGRDIVDKKDLHEAQRGDIKAGARAATQFGGWAAGQRYSPISTLNSALTNPNQGVAGGLRDALLDLKNPSGKAQKYEAQTPRRLNQDHNRRVKNPTNIGDKILGATGLD